ncbi:conserved hypothetical protein [Acidithiobacillus caldus SM-1]|uniref:Uncharacterized protein n=1 Tax=Acidithiobacillus caldus (strain SM-1) TaxID=990288 RepID=F9ZT66_ACICS|nr:conserved hypothetical protein [Acidithiobacillus caldus SM-1]QER45231.1 hypothetical protein F0726_02174 [Acidithiobacillus caldus]
MSHKEIIAGGNAQDKRPAQRPGRARVRRPWARSPK